MTKSSRRDFMPVSKCPSLARTPLVPAPPSGTSLSFREPIVGTPDFPIAAYYDKIERNAVIWHWHEEFEIGCITEGSIIAEIGNRKYTLSRGELFFINSKVMHSMRNVSPGAPAVFKALTFDGSIVGGNENSVFHRKYVLPIIKNTGLRGYIFRKGDTYTDRIFPDMINLWSAVCDEENGYELYVRNELSTFFQLMLNCTAGSTFHISDGEQRLESRARIMLNYIHSHYSNTVTLQEIADSASVSTSEALRCFKKIIGVSPIQYLKKYRLQKAAAFIESSSYSIKEVCNLCGFSDCSYFSKSFKEVYHCTPNDYSKR